MCLEMNQMYIAFCVPKNVIYVQCNKYSWLLQVTLLLYVELISIMLNVAKSR